VVADLGADKLYFMFINSAKMLDIMGEICLPKEQGPRHCHYISDERILLVVGELASTLIVI